MDFLRPHAQSWPLTSPGFLGLSEHRGPAVRQSKDILLSHETKFCFSCPLCAGLQARQKAVEMVWTMCQTLILGNTEKALRRANMEGGNLRGPQTQAKNYEQLRNAKREKESSPGKSPHIGCPLKWSALRSYNTGRPGWLLNSQKSTCCCPLSAEITGVWATTACSFFFWWWGGDHVFKLTFHKAIPCPLVPLSSPQSAFAGLNWRILSAC